MNFPWHRDAHVHLQYINLPISPHIFPPLCMILQTPPAAAQPLPSLRSVWDPGIGLNIIFLYLLEVFFSHGIEQSLGSAGCAAEDGGAQPGQAPASTVILLINNMLIKWRKLLAEYQGEGRDKNVVREGLKESPLLSSPRPCDSHHTSLLNPALKAVAFPKLPRGGC